jgi:LCP family protein required for cell wall assembly
VPGDTTNILLLGSDTPLGEEDSRTDTLIVVTINRSGPTASMISLPRDLFVYIPGRTMGRLNTAVRLEGIDLLKQTILYNFGIPIHYYARVDFEGFKEAVDAIEGVEVSVSCRLRDWRLRSPELDPKDEENWEQFTLEPGVHQMDGDLALWYVRSRLSSNDFYRGRRQQQLLRALLNQGVDLDLIGQVPALWSTFQNQVETDIDIGRLLQLAALAPSIRENGVQNLFLAGKTETWIVPDSGAHVQLPVWEGDGKMQETFRRLFLPPALSRSTRPPMTVELVSVADNPDLVVLAADNLAWHGFHPLIASPDSYPELQERSATELRYYASNFKGSYDWLLSWIFHKNRSQIELISDDADYPYDYQVLIGDDYDPCLDQLYAPQPFLDP